MLPRPDGNVIDSNYTRDFNDHVTRCDITGHVTYLRWIGCRKNGTDNGITLD